jgi:hypothetical protein
VNRNLRRPDGFDKITAIGIAIWGVSFIAGLAFLGVIIWGIVTLVTHFTS